VAPSPTYSGSNQLLAKLSRRDFILLAKHLKAVDLPVRKRLEMPNRRVTAAYFIESGFASVVGNGRTGGIEVGLVGREGMTGLSILLGAEKAALECFVQVAGAGQCIPAAELKSSVAESDTLQRVLLRYVHDFGVQVSYTATTNARSKIEERLARWLLAAQDRVGDDDLPLTHEFLSIMLGVRRPGVTLALHELEKKGMIIPGHRSIRIVDRKGLERASNGAYGPAEARMGQSIRSSG
jgi:CRP-like cAMP-binding protein